VKPVWRKGWWSLFPSFSSSSSGLAISEGKAKKPREEKGEKGGVWVKARLVGGPINKDGPCSADVSDHQKKRETDRDEGKRAGGRIQALDGTAVSLEGGTRAQGNGHSEAGRGRDCNVSDSAV
jgi:hypothetical protein